MSTCPPFFALKTNFSNCTQLFCALNENNRATKALKQSRKTAATTTTTITACNNRIIVTFIWRAKKNCKIVNWFIIISIFFCSTFFSSFPCFALLCRLSPSLSHLENWMLSSYRVFVCVCMCIKHDKMLGEKSQWFAWEVSRQTHTFTARVLKCVLVWFNVCKCALSGTDAAHAAHAKNFSTCTTHHLTQCVCKLVTGHTDHICISHVKVVSFWYTSRAAARQQWLLWKCFKRCRVVVGFILSPFLIHSYHFVCSLAFRFVLRTHRRESNNLVIALYCNWSAIFIHILLCFFFFQLFSCFRVRKEKRWKLSIAIRNLCV